MFNKLKQFKDLKNQANQLKETLAQETAEGSTDWGKVKVKIDGNQEILNVEIDPELLTSDNKEKLEQDIKEATNDAIKKVQKIMADTMQQSGLNFPGM
ncbi:MAG: YbaB/EbfC family nucleoid-associated protein [Candidatus Buchananbacteria bacterium]|nr:YbaB/EbfC family nucleoid-associated protein [Candidatus Buchananbacteria bacterium]